MEVLYQESVADLFDLLAITMKCPDRELLAALFSGAVKSDFEAIAEELGWGELNARLRGEWEALELLKRELDEEGFFSKLRAEYTRLFITPKTAEIAIHESVFLIKPGRMPDLGPLIMRSPAAMDARECYRKAGLTMTERISADHMAIEAEFMAYLWRGCPDEKQIEQKAYFEEKHLKRWMQAFFVKCEEKTRHPFYRIVGAFGQALAKEIF